MYASRQGVRRLQQRGDMLEHGTCSRRTQLTCRIGCTVLLPVAALLFKMLFCKQLFAPWGFFCTLSSVGGLLCPYRSFANVWRLRVRLKQKLASFIEEVHVLEYCLLFMLISCNDYRSASQGFFPLSAYSLHHRCLRLFGVEVTRRVYLACRIFVNQDILWRSPLTFIKLFVNVCGAIVHAALALASSQLVCGWAGFLWWVTRRASSKQFLIRVLG